MSFSSSYKHTNCSNVDHADKHQLIRADRKSIAPQPYSAIKCCSIAKHKALIRYIFNLSNLITAGENETLFFSGWCYILPHAQHFKAGCLVNTFSVRTHLKSQTVQFSLGFIFCRNTLSEVLCLLRGLPHRLLWLPAVLHRHAELSLHLLLQHPALQRAQEEASHPLGGDVQPADEPASSPLPDPPPVTVHTPPCDVDRWRHDIFTVQFVFFGLNQRKETHLSLLHWFLVHLGSRCPVRTKLGLVSRSQKAEFCLPARLEILAAGEGVKSNQALSSPVSCPCNFS